METLERIRHRHNIRKMLKGIGLLALFRSDSDDDIEWISTESGTHIPLNEEGVAVGGFAKGQTFSQAESISTSIGNVPSGGGQTAKSGVAKTSVGVAKKSGGGKKSKASATPKRDYSSSLATAVGQQHYDAIRDMAEACPSESVKAIWYKMGESTPIADAHITDDNHRHDAGEGGVFTNIKIDAMGVYPYNPYTITTHECGHSIDCRLTKDYDYDNKPYSMYSSQYKDGIFPKTITEEVNALIDPIREDIQSHSDDLDYLKEKGYLRKSRKTIPKMTEKNLNKMIEPYLNNMFEAEAGIQGYGDLTDMISGATDGKIQSGMGHEPVYWEDGTYDGVRSALAVEAFAEMTSASIANPTSLAIIKKYLPKSYAIYEEMVKNALS